MDFYSDYLKRISEKNIVLYGAGKYGNIAYKELVHQGLADKVIGFAETQRSDKQNELFGKPVYSINEADFDFASVSFVITLAEKHHEAVKKTLEAKGANSIYSGIPLVFDSYRVSADEWKANENRRLRYMSEISKGNSNSSVRATHITYPLVGNAGDTYLSWCVREYLGFGSWNVIKVSDEVTQETIDTINASDVLVIGGGGLFLPDSNENSISGWQWAISNDMLDKITVPIVVYSVGYNYFPGQKPSELFIDSLNHLVRKAAFVGLRNIGSMENVSALLENDLKDKIVYQPCITTIMDKVVDDRHSDIKDIQESIGKQIALNLAFDRTERRFGESKEQILESIAAAMKALEGEGNEIIYVAHCDRDMDFLEYLDKANVKYTQKNLTRLLPDDIISFYTDRVDMVVGMRGHAQMIPYGLGKKIISLVSHDKMKWFLEDTGLTECSVDLRQKPEGITEKIIDTVHYVAKSDEIEHRLIESKERLFEISEQNKSVINGLLGE